MKASRVNIFVFVKQVLNVDLTEAQEENPLDVEMQELGAVL